MSNKITCQGLVTYNLTFQKGHFKRLKMTLLLRLEKLLPRVNYIKLEHKMYIVPDSKQLQHPAYR